MTQNDPNDFDPKHRIIGAVIIVSLAVIFVPMILDRRSTPSDTSSVSQIPAPTGDAENKVVVTPVPPPAPKSAAPEKPIADAEPPKPAVVEAPKAAPKPTAPAADKPAPTKPAAKEANSAPAKPAPKAAEIKSGWVVQVGTFSNATNAARLEEQLKKHGHAVSRERVARDGNSALRLRVGPFKDKALAQKAQGQIEKETGVKGVVLAYP